MISTGTLYSCCRPYPASSPLGRNADRLLAQEAHEHRERRTLADHQKTEADEEKKRGEEDHRPSSAGGNDLFVTVERSC